MIEIHLAFPPACSLDGVYWMLLYIYQFLIKQGS